MLDLATMFWTGLGIVPLCLVLNYPLKGNGAVVFWVMLPLCNATYALRHPPGLGGFLASLLGVSCAIMPWFWWRYRRDAPAERFSNLFVVGLFVVGGTVALAGAGMLAGNLLHLGLGLLGR